MRFSALIAAILLSAPGCTRAQATHDHGGMTGADDVAAGAEAASGVNDAMTRAATRVNPHIELTPARRATSADSVRAQQILKELRDGIGRYTDYKVAFADGYEPFLANVKLPVYHFTSTRRAIRASFTFDAAEPTSLLYEKDGSGYKLVGAMYTAPKRASLDDLDARVPLSIAQWHAHVNICVPKASERQRWRESSGGQMRFGPAGAIATEDECRRAGGRWFPQLFGWMVHVNPYERDPSRIWGTHGAGSHSGGSHGSHGAGEHHDH